MGELGFKKSNFVVFHPYQRKIDRQIDIKLNSSTTEPFHLECKNYVKYLGILIDKHLTWKNHIDSISNKISRIVGIISKLRHFLPKQVLLNLYKSLIHPHLTYGISIWGQTSKSVLDKLLILQKRVLRFIFFKKPRESAIPLFIESNILPVTLLHLESLSQVMYDAVHNRAPSNICNMFVSIENIHPYNTRSATSGKLFLKPSRINLQKNSLSRIGVKFWNRIPENIRNLPRSRFKKEFKNILFRRLKEEGYYLDISKL